MTLNLLDVIEEFCKMFKFEYLEDEFELVITDDIAGYIESNDQEYYRLVRDEIETAQGTLYAKVQNKPVLLIDKKIDDHNLVYTAIHEYIHFCDFQKYIIKIGKISFREAFQNESMSCWSEFHAFYMSTRYMFAKLDLSYEEAVETISKPQDFPLNPYTQKREISIYGLMSLCGRYAALYDRYPDKTYSRPIKCGFHGNFIKMYNYLFTHTTIEDFLKDSTEFVNIMNNL